MKGWVRAGVVESRGGWVKAGWVRVGLGRGEPG